MSCSHSSSCELYRHFSLAPVLEIWKTRFCKSPTRHTECARFKLSVARQPVPPNLLPNGQLLPIAADLGPGKCGP